MKLQEKDEEHLKKWMTDHLEKTYDADSEVLVDYVLALLQDINNLDEGLQRLSQELEAFLDEHTTKFVADLVQALRSGSYRPGLPSKPATNKRSLGQYSDAPGGDGSRSSKVQRASGSARGGRYSTPTHGNGNHVNPRMPSSPDDGLTIMTERGYGNGIPSFRATAPQGLPMVYDNGFRDPFAASQSFANPFVPQFQHIPGGEICVMYATTGMCMLGPACPFLHAVAPQETAMNMFAPPFPSGRGQRRSYRNTPNHPVRGSPRHKHRGTAVAVENIPENHHSDEGVFAFFERFGPIEHIHSDFARSRAVITFSTNAAASKAVSSPDVVFDNRFVRVDFVDDRRNDRSDISNVTQEMGELDFEEFERKAAAAQARYEDRVARLAENQARRAEVEARIRTQEAERRVLLARLAARDGTTPPTDVELDSDESTQDLKAKLARLRAEATSLGLNEDGSRVHKARLGYSRGGYGPGYAPVGRGRSAWTLNVAKKAGREPAGPDTSPRTGRIVAAVKRLDNRPKSVTVTLPADAQPDRPATFRDPAALDALKAALASVGPHTGISAPQGARGERLVVGFPLRFLAEKFADLVASRRGAVPGLGAVELGWSRDDPGAGPAEEAGAGGEDMAHGKSGDAAGDADMDEAEGEDEHEGIPDAPAERMAGGADAWRPRADANLDID